MLTLVLQDVGRYVKNYMAGLEIVWQNFLDGKDPDHVFLQESEDASRGSFESDILSHPITGRTQR